jgi:hypothetical protein
LETCKDFWTGDDLFKPGAAAEREKIGQATRGGGTQYVVANQSAMKKL